MELTRAGIASPGPNIRSLVGLDGPAIDWVKLAAGFGVPGESVRTAEDLAGVLGRTLAEPGPFLIEMILRRKMRQTILRQFCDKIETAAGGVNQDEAMAADNFIGRRYGS